MAATIKRPVRVEEGTGQDAVVERLGGRVAEFEPWRLPRTLRRRKSWPWLLTMVEVLEVEVAREKSRATAP